MKNLFLSFLCILFAHISYSQLVGIGFELTYEHPDELIEDLTLGPINLAGYKTWTLYAYVENSDDVFSVLYGDMANPAFVTLSEGSEFFHHPFGSDFGPINEAFVGITPLAAYDSFFNIGPLYSSENSGPTSFVEDPEFPWIENFLDGGDVIMNSVVGGAVFIVPGMADHGIAGDDLKIELGQFTTNGTITAELCISIFTNGDQNNEATNCGVNAIASSDYGCMDSAACNFSSVAIFDNGTCTYPNDSCNDFNSNTSIDTYNENCECIGYVGGCTDTYACNFESTSEIDDDSCLYPGDICAGEGSGFYDSNCECLYTVTGVVFQDDNYNGIPDPNESRIPYQNIEIEELGITVITNDNGEFAFSGLNEGSYSLTANYTYDWTTFTTDATQSLNFPANAGNPVYFGVTNEAAPAPTACVDFYQWGAGVPCNDVLGYNICYRNMSPYPISGLVEVELDPLVSYNSSYPSNATVDGNTVSWEFTNLGSWQMYFDDVLINTPDETHIGEFMTNSVAIYVWYNNELVEVTGQTVNQEVTCAYDPNDITGIPEGYTDEHFVLPDTRMEYLIRFQNTGNAPAGTVTVVDTLDVDMDWNSFELIANSHSVMTTIEQESGRVEFLFEDINLIDSIANEPESHGMVSFKIDFADGTPIGEEINQTAHIFFDNNPAVVTNTTWHTIHECGGEGAFESTAIEVCAGEEIAFSSTYPYVEDYQWNIDAAPFGNNENFTQTFPEAGEYIVQLVSENPICNEATSQMITVYELPTAEITENGALLTANEGTEYQWYLNGEEITDATSQTYEAIEDGNYYVMVTNENNCSMQSGEVMVVSIDELSNSGFTIYPNPMSNSTTISYLSSEPKTIYILDSQGKIVKSWENVTENELVLEKGQIRSGMYSVYVVSEQKTLVSKLLIN